MLKLYGQQIKLFKYGRMPAQVLVDKAGIARFVHYGHDMSDIPSNEEILGLIDGLNAERRKHEPAPEPCSGTALVPRPSSSGGAGTRWPSCPSGRS